ncbi:MAG: thioredoxin family protein [Planctomycetota bacterium]
MNLPRFFAPTAAVAASCLLAASALAVPEGWTDDFESAKATAAAEGKDLLMDFTGSDWCPPCKALKSEVFETEAFKSTIPDGFVLVELDFPNNVPQTPEVVAQNQRLQAEYGIRGYPTVVLADAEGRPYGFTGYRPGGPEPYLAHIAELKQAKSARDAAFAAADSQEGVARAKALDEALEAVGLDLAVAHYGPTVEEIIALDADDAAGLKSKYRSAYQDQKLEAEMQAVLQTLGRGDFGEGLAEIDRIIETYDPAPEQLQLMTAIKGQVHMQLAETDKAIALLEEAIEIAPDSEVTPQLRDLLKQLNPG